MCGFISVGIGTKPTKAPGSGNSGSSNGNYRPTSKPTNSGNAIGSGIFVYFRNYLSYSF